MSAVETDFGDRRADPCTGRWLRIVHDTVPGRIRVSVAGFKRDPRLAAVPERRLGGHLGIVEARAEDRTTLEIAEELANDIAKVWDAVRPA